MKIRVYDIEIYKNYVLLGVLDFHDDGSCDTYYISDIERIRKINFEIKDVYWIGFNNRRYDQPVLEYIKRNPGITEKQVYEFQHSIIMGLHENETISWNKQIIDLYEIMPLPGAQKCSLKEIGHRLRYKFLEDLPFQDTHIREHDIPKIKEYNLHDLLITYEFWKVLRPIYNARQSIQEIFDVRTEFGGIPNIGKKVVLKLMGDDDYVNVSYNLKKMDNLRLSYDLQKAYDVCFSRSPMDYDTDEQLEPLGTVYDIKGCKCKLLKGGIHGMLKPGVYHYVYEYDVTSYYPNILMKCELGSDTFRAAMRFLFKQRKDYIAMGNKVYSEALKLVLNSITGNLANKKYGHPRIKSESAALSMRFLGQFYLMDLIEKLGQDECLVVNTDGIYVKHEVPEAILKEWQQRTGFTLVKKEYKTLVLSDVNSYYAVDLDGNEKRKKEFLKPRWDRNVNAPIIQKAALNFIMYDIPITQTLMKEKDIYSFCYFKKVSRKDGNCLMLDSKKLDFKKARFFVSTSPDAAELSKIVNGRTSKVCKDYKVVICNDLSYYDRVDFRPIVDYAYYEDKINLLLKKVGYYCG